MQKAYKPGGAASNTQRPSGQTNQPSDVMPKAQASIGQIEQQLKKLKQTKPKTKELKSEIARQKSELNKLYAANKKRIAEFEKTNYEYLALVRSTNDFYKLFGHSALFYAYSIAPKLNLQANLQADNDFTARSSEGFVSVRQPEKLTEVLNTLKIKKVKTKSQTGDFILYKLPWTYTDEQLNDFVEHNHTRMQKFNHIVIVDNVIPVLFIEIEELLKSIYENVRGMSGPTEKETLGYTAINSTAKMAHIYLDLANGHFDKLTGLKKLKQELKIVKYQTKLIADLKIWTPKTCARIGENIIKVQDIIERELKNI